MDEYTGWVAEVIVDPSDPAGRVVKIACEPGVIPEPGQYIKAWHMDHQDAPLPANLFATGYIPYGFTCRPPASENWQPGSAVKLSGPLGVGFHLPGSRSRLALVTLSVHSDRLMPLADRALKQNYAVTLFGNRPFPGLPIAIEAYPLSDLAEMLSWADVLAFDAPRLSLSNLRPVLKLNQDDRLPIPAQILVDTWMPCSGLGDCGACAVPLKRGWALACRNGPVFNLEDLEW